MTWGESVAVITKTFFSARPPMLVRQCLRQRPPPTFINICYNCQNYTSHSIKSSTPPHSDESVPSRPVIPPTWPKRQPQTTSPTEPVAVPESPSTSPLQEILSILTTKSAVGRTEELTISAFTPTTAKHFYPQGPDFKPPIGTPWNPESKAWRRHVARPGFPNKSRRNRRRTQSFRKRRLPRRQTT